MTAPVNVKLKETTVVLKNWQEQKEQWLSLNAAVKGNPDFYPLTIKALYVIGVIHDICESVDHLLHFKNIRITYIPAYGVFAAGIEILGRCVRGNDSVKGEGAVKDLKTGFKWLAYSSNRDIPCSKVDSIPDDRVLVQTKNDKYTIEGLTFLRHFAAHGQAAAPKLGEIDYEILDNMPPLVASGLETYWSELQCSEERCNDLAKANIRAFRNWPVFKSWSLFGEQSVCQMFSKFNWRIEKSLSNKTQPKV